MEFGVAIFPTEGHDAPGRRGRGGGERGFDAIYFPEHTHIPASRETPDPTGGDLPGEYSRTYDPLIALTAAGAATERIRLRSAGS